ncbi:557_t:CDS:2, partial [Racocetra fulgida]
MYPFPRLPRSQSFRGTSNGPSRISTSDGQPWMSTQYFKFKLITDDSIDVVANMFLQDMIPEGRQPIKYDFMSAATRSLPYGRVGDREMIMVMKIERVSLSSLTLDSSSGDELDSSQNTIAFECSSASEPTNGPEISDVSKNDANELEQEFDGPNQFNQQPPFVGHNHHIGSFQQHSHYIGHVQHPQLNGPTQQPLILNGPHYPRTDSLINGPDQLPQIAEINNINDINNIPPATNQHIQYPNHQATNSVRNYSIQPPLTPVQANIQINNNLQRQQSFTSQTSNTTNQHLQDFRNCNCQ